MSKNSGSSGEAGSDGRDRQFAAPAASSSAALADPCQALLSIDVEDWHQLVGRHCGVRAWDVPTAGLERQMGVVFDLLEELSVEATFFVLGMSVKNYEHIVQEIVRRGHEVACHGFHHDRIYDQTPEEFRRDVEETMELVERISGRRPSGYRAPAFSINRDCLWSLEILADLGLRYDASLHDSPKIPHRLGRIPTAPFLLRLPSGRTLWEFPVTVLRLLGRSLPVGGGSYWRLLPRRFLARTIRCAAKGGAPPTLYFHPYEFDSEPLRFKFEESVTLAQRLSAAYLEARYRPGHGSIVGKLRELAKQYRMVSYEEALGSGAGSGGQDARSLSKDGVIV